MLPSVGEAESIMESECDRLEMPHGTPTFDSIEKDRRARSGLSSLLEKWRVRSKNQPVHWAVLILVMDRTDEYQLPSLWFKLFKRLILERGVTKSSSYTLDLECAGKYQVILAWCGAIYVTSSAFKYILDFNQAATLESGQKKPDFQSPLSQQALCRHTVF